MPYLDAVVAYGMNNVERARTITACTAELLASARAHTGEGVSETLRIGLQRLAHERACKAMLEMRGKVKFERDWRELRGKDDEDDRRLCVLIAFLEGEPGPESTPWLT